MGQIEVIESNGRRIVKKKYSSEPGLVKWFIIKSLSLPLQIYPYTLSSRERMKREIEFFQEKPGGVYTPSVIEVDWENLVLYREYVDGEPMVPGITIDKIKCVADALYSIHSSGYCMGDSKHNNFLYAGDDRVYVIDAEQSTRCKRDYMKAWDLIVFITTIIYALGFAKGLKSVCSAEEILCYIKNFIDKYVDRGGCQYVSEIDSNTRLKTLAQILLPPPYSIKFIQYVKESVKK